MHGEYEPHDALISLNLVNCETPRISKEEPTTPFVPCPPHFLVPMWVPPCYDNKFGKYENQILNPSLHPPFASHVLDLMKETPKWLMDPRVKANPFTPQDEIDTLNINLEYGSIESFTYSRGICHPLSSTCHESTYHDPCDQFSPPTSPSRSPDSSCWFKLQLDTRKSHYIGRGG